MLKFLAEKIDLYSNKPEFKVEGNPRFRTKFGILIGLISIIMLTSIYAFYLYECLFKSNINVSYNEKRNSKPIIPLKNMKIAISLFRGFLEEFPEQDRLVSIYARHLKSSLVDTSKMDSEYLNNITYGNIVEIPLKKCTKFLDESFSIFFAQISLFKPNTVCLELDNFEEDLFGRFGSIDK